MNDLVCYCFGFTEEDIKADLLENGKSEILEKIIKEKQLGGCQCSIKNPKGR